MRLLNKTRSIQTFSKAEQKKQTFVHFGPSTSLSSLHLSCFIIFLLKRPWATVIVHSAAPSGPGEHISLANIFQRSNAQKEQICTHRIHPDRVIVLARFHLWTRQKTIIYMRMEGMDTDCTVSAVSVTKL